MDSSVSVYVDPTETVESHDTTAPNDLCNEMSKIREYYISIRNILE